MRTLALIAFALCLAAPARASSVHVAETRGPDSASEPPLVTLTARLVGAPGERNRVRVRRLGQDRVRFADAARLRAGAGCTARGPHVAVCRLAVRASVREVALALSDGDDVADLSAVGFNATVHGGAGPDFVLAGAGDDAITGDGGGDTLAGGSGTDRVNGGSGADRLHGGTGADTLTDGPGFDRAHGGRGSDELVSADDGLDRFDGGPGRDRVSYARRRRPVTVDLGSSAGGRDLLARIENVRGGAGDDDLSGDGRPNVIDGGPGADVMNGQGGGDRFRTSGFDDIDCGNGADAVLPTPSEDYLVEPDCETVQPTLAGGPLPAQPTSVTADAVTMQLPCGGDPATLTTPAGPRRYDREGPFGVDVAAGSCDTPLALTDEGRALARPAVVRVAFGDSGWHFRLPAP